MKNRGVCRFLIKIKNIFIYLMLTVEISRTRNKEESSTHIKKEYS